MKTSAIAAQLFEQATAQTQKGASAASTAEFSQLLANARSTAFASPMGEDGADLVSRRREPVRSAEQQPQRQDAVRERPQASQPRDTQRAERRPESRAAERPDDTTDVDDSVDVAAEDVAEAAPAASDDDAGEQAAAATDGDDTAAPTEPAATTAPAAAAQPTVTAETSDPSAEALAAINTAPAPTDAPAESPAEAATTGAAAPAKAAATQPAADTAEHAPAEAASDVARAAVDAARQQTAEGGKGAEVSAAVHQAQQRSTPAKAAETATDQAATPADAATVTADVAVTQAATAPKTTAAAKGASPQQQGQAAELAGLANGAGLTVKSNAASTGAPKTDLVGGGALMAQAVDGTPAEAGAFLGGDAADQFLMNDQARAALATAMGRVEQAQGNALASKPFAAAAAAEAAAPTGAANVATTSQPVAGIGSVGATGAASPTGIAQAASHAHGTQVPAPVQQVSTALASAISKGQDSISVQLNPDELGRVDITLDFQDGRVSATIVADKPETLDMLQKDSRTLEKMLSDAGLRTDQQSLNFSLRGDSQQNQQLAREQRASRSRAQLLAIDDGLGAAATAPQSRARTTVGGLDISV